MRRCATRRSLLRASALAGTGLLAGCSLVEDSPGDAGDDHPGTDTVARTATAGPDGEELIVAPDGDEDAEGTESDPLALDAALDRVGDVVGRDDPPDRVAVTLLDGTYRRDESVDIWTGNIGWRDVPLLVRSGPDGTAVLRGGVTLPTGDFRPVSDGDVRDRLPETAREEVREFDLAAHGITEYGDLVPRGFGLPDVPPLPELFVDDAAMERARWPNDDWVEIGPVSDAGPDPRPRIAADPTRDPVDAMVEWRRNGRPRPLPEYFDDGATFQYENDRIESWESPQDAWLYGFWYNDWADGHLAIESIDPEGDTLTTETASWYNVRAGQRYYYYNVLEELDRPGEFYVDRDAGMLYLYPPTDLADAEVSFSTLVDPLVSISGVDNVTLRDLEFDTSRGPGVHVDGGESVTIENCRFHKLAGRAADLTGKRHGVVGCRIDRTGAGGVSITGGDRDTLTPGGNYALNNEISRFSRIERTYSPAVSVGGVGNHVAHNHLHDAPHMALGFSGNEHVIEYNEIDHVARETDDVGAIYTGRDWTQRGNVVRHNFIHHVRNEFGGHGQTAVYLDDQYSGTRVYGNVLFEVNRAMLIGGGRNNEVVNNLVVNCEEGIRVDARGAPGNWRHDICTQSDGPLRTHLDRVPYQSEPWSSRYPDLPDILEDDPCLPKGNAVRRNVVVSDVSLLVGVDAAPSAREHGTIENNAIEHTPDGDHGFRVRDGTPTIAGDSIIHDLVEGWEALPLERMGTTESPEDWSLDTGDG